VIPTVWCFVERDVYQLLQRLATEHGAELGISKSDSASGSNDEPPDAPTEATEQRAKRQVRNKRKSRMKAPRARYWSPHDPDASFGHKGLGYHVHITETCRNVGTELLTSYAVLPAAQSDIGQAMPALQRLEQSDLKPEVLYADAGYPTSTDLMASRAQGVELFAPVHRGRLAEDTFSRSEFELDARGGVLRCPQGHAPTRHAERESSDTIHPRRSLHAFFRRDTCNACPQLQRCPVRQPNHAYADYRLDVAPEMLVRDARWTEQQTEPWKKRYGIRAGIEATMSELKRAHGLGRLRVRRLARVIIQVALKTTACNIKRWLRALCPQNDPNFVAQPLWLLMLVSGGQQLPSKSVCLAA
jgi:hypothetical protein